MFETSGAIKNQILAGEDTFAEFKEVRFGQHGVISPNSEDMAGEMVALANSEGGAVFLGVDDDRVIRGIPSDRVHQVEDWVANVATNNCDPPIRPILRSVVLPDPTGTLQHLLLVEVHKAFYVHHMNSGHWLLRVGSSKRDLAQAELSRLFHERGRTFVFDETPVPDAGQADLDESLLREHLGSPRGIDWRQLLLNRRILIVQADGVNCPTVAALLAFSKDPSIHLQGAFIEAAVYRGARRHSDGLVHTQQIRGPVASQVDDAMEFVDRFMLRPSRKDVGREDFPQYKLGPVHEAIVNAVAHRDYSIHGSKTRLFLYADRLELINPGGLPNTVTLETMRYRQFTRNQLLVSFLSRMRSRFGGKFFLEQRGEGVARILEESLAYSGREPSYELRERELHLTIWALPSPHERT